MWLAAYTDVAFRLHARARFAHEGAPGYSWAGATSDASTANVQGGAGGMLAYSGDPERPIRSIVNT